MIGFLLGLILVLVNVSLKSFASPVLSSVALVTLLAWLTRGLHLDGLGDTFDGLGAGGDRERMLSVMDDSHTGAFRCDCDRFAVVLQNPRNREHGHRALARVARRAGPRPLGDGAAGLPFQSGKGGTGFDFNRSLVERNIFSSPRCVTLLLVAAILRGTGVFMMAWVAVFSLASKNYFHRRLGGVTGDTFGAVGELSETSVIRFLGFGR